MIRLYGTITSPYVRRVRIVAEELRLACELVDTATEAGQAQLRGHSPIWKVPAAEIDGTLVFDSHVITELLVARHGGNTIRALGPEDIEARNVIAVIDGALEALINCLYLGRDGIGVDQSAYLAKQHERAAASLTWLEDRIDAGWLTSDHQFGLVEIALGTALGWIRFRQMAPLDRNPRLMAAFAELELRDSFILTQPA